MAYDETYAERVQDALVGIENVEPRKMFGSLGFMVDGHLTVCVGDGKDGHILMVRVGKAAADACANEPGASTTVMGKRQMNGWIDLTPEAVATEEQLQTWVDRAIAFVNTLPPKEDGTR